MHPNLHHLPFIEKITDVDAIKKVNPEVVVVWADKKQPFHRKSEDILNSLKIPFVYVIVGNLGDVPDYPAALEFLGRLLGKEESANRMADYCRKTLEEIESIVARVPVDRNLKVYYAEGEDGLLTEFDDSLHGHLLQLIGDVNMVRGHMTEHKGLERYSLALIEQGNPDVIITWSRNLAEKIMLDPAWSRINAVRDRRVFPIPNVPFNWFDRPPCFMRIIGLKWLASVLYPDYCKFDLIDETVDFFSVFLDAKIDGFDAENIISQKLRDGLA
ncbi:MAG: ABC transporter substrate-binding protein [Candidatus Rifleibacteriota bacterium]